MCKHNRAVQSPHEKGNANGQIDDRRNDRYIFGES